MVGFEIAPMTTGDYEEVVELWRTTVGVGLDEDDTREGVGACLARSPGLSFVARQEGRVVGAVLCGHDGRRGYLYHLAVAAPSRRRGIGGALVKACLAGLGRIGIPKCSIFLFDGNEIGEAFWKRVGWKERCDLKVLQKMTSCVS